MRVALLVAVLAWTSLAHAQRASEPELAPPGLSPVTRHVTRPVPFHHWPGAYHGRILAFDGLALLMFAGTAASDNESFIGIGLSATVATYALGGPIVHLGKGHPGRAFLSLTMRVGLPLVGYRLGESSGEDGNAALGVVLGLLTAMAVDDIVLARGERPHKPEPTWTPTARTTQGGVEIGVAAFF